LTALRVGSLEGEADLVHGEEPATAVPTELRWDIGLGELEVPQAEQGEVVRGGGPGRAQAFEVEGLVFVTVHACILPSAEAPSDQTEHEGDLGDAEEQAGPEVAQPADQAVEPASHQRQLEAHQGPGPEAGADPDRGRR
jgi:hypothetical protein